MSPQNLTDVGERLARIEEALIHFREDRDQAHQDRKDLISEIKDLRGDVANIQQTLLSTQNVVHNIALEKCGERLTQHDTILERHDNRILRLETVTKNVPHIETEIELWRTIFGTGSRAVWRIILVVLGSASAGGGIVKLVDWILHGWH